MVNCRECGKEFIPNPKSRRYCNDCINLRQSIFYSICDVRRLYHRLIKDNPIKAIELKKEMIKEEGEEFTNFCIDGILENNVSSKDIEIIKKFEG